MSKQKTLDFAKYFTKAAAEAPEKDPISKILIFLSFKLFKCFK